MKTKKDVLQNKINDYVERSGKNSEKLVDQLTNRFIDDVVIPKQLLKFSGNGGIHVNVQEGNKTHDWIFTQNSAYQLADRIGLPQKWVSTAPDGSDFQRDAVAYALNRYMENYSGKDERFLMRKVNNVVRGFLSTSYKRLNTREIFLSFLIMAQNNGWPIVGACEGESRDYLECINPEIVYLDTPNNGVVCYATYAQLKNSDFGDGRLELRSGKLYPVCLNGATGMSIIREVHLGARMAQDFIFSIETVNHDTETRALMVRDAMDYIFSDRNRQFEEAQIIEASGEVVEVKYEIERLPQLGLSKTEKNIVEGILLKHSEEDGIVGNASKFLVHQAVTAMAREAEPIRQRELQQIAGNMVFTKDPEVLEFKEN